MQCSEARVQFLGQENSLERGRATHSSILAWRILWAEEPGGLRSTGSQRVGHNWAINTHIHLLLFRFFSPAGDYSVLSRAPYALQQVTATYLFIYSSVYNPIFHCLRTCHTIFSNSCTTWHCHWQCPTVAVSLHTHSVHFRHSVESNSLWPHGPQHIRPPCPSPTPGVYSNSCPLSQWCHPAISFILCRPRLLLPSIFPSIRVFSNESVLRIRWPKYWSFSFNISPSNEYSGLISFGMEIILTNSCYFLGFVSNYLMGMR